MLRDTRAEVDLGRIRSNVMAIREHLPEAVKLMAVVKAGGYGHGDIETARIAGQAGADLLAVAYLDEAIRLREHGLSLPILILTPIHPDEIMIALKHDLMLTVTAAAWFQQMRCHKPYLSRMKIKVHVKADTGLGRIGFQTKEEWEELVPWLQEPDIIVDGFYTHFATASQADTCFLEHQYARFQEMIAWSKASRLKINHYHCAGSAAALRFPELALDMVRIGAALFGYYPEKLVQSVKLEPALSLYSRIIQVKKLRQGECIGYDNSYVAEEEQWIGTVPIGYADGWSQRLQGSEMLVDGERVPVVGKICMDQLMVRLARPCEPGTEVTLIGRQGKDEIKISELASHAGCVHQEISTSISARIERIYKED